MKKKIEPPIEVIISFDPAEDADKRLEKVVRILLSHDGRQKKTLNVQCEHTEK
jgi:hypothetical protein